jgi:hypothetical protein
MRNKHLKKTIKRSTSLEIFLLKTLSFSSVSDVASAIVNDIFSSSESVLDSIFGGKLSFKSVFMFEITYLKSLEVLLISHIDPYGI